MQRERGADSMRSLDRLITNLETRVKKLKKGKDERFCQCNSPMQPIILFSKTDEDRAREYQEKLSKRPKTCRKCGKPFNPDERPFIIAFTHHEHPSEAK